MRVPNFVLTALAAQGLLASATSIHVDVSQDGDIAVDLNTDPRPAPRVPTAKQSERTRTREQGRKGSVKPLELKENQVDLWYEVHQGFLSVSFAANATYLHEDDNPLTP